MDQKADHVFSLCEPAIKKYIIELTGSDQSKLFPEGIPEFQGAVFIKKDTGLQNTLILDLVDHDQKFDFNGFESKTVMEYITLAQKMVQAVGAITLKTITQDMCSTGYELIEDGYFVFDPSLLNCMIYTKKYGEYVRDNIKQRIGFKWIEDQNNND